MRDGALLVSLIPLVLKGRWFFRRLLFFGKDDQLDLLARRGWETEVCEAGVEALRQMDGWHVATLRDTSPDAAAWGIFRQWDGPRSHTGIGSHMWIESKPGDELLMSLRKSLRSSVRQALRRADEDVIRCSPARAEDAEQAARRLVTLHRELWQGRSIVRERLTARFETFIVAAARRNTTRDLGTILEWWRNGKLMLSVFLVYGNEIVHVYLVGASQEARQRLQWSSLWIWEALNIARSRNCAYISLDRGWEPYKMRWAPKEVPYYQITLARSPVILRSYLAYCYLYYSLYPSLRSKAAEYGKLYVTLRWIKRRLLH